mgnify:CR=1 FL=1
MIKIGWNEFRNGSKESASSSSILFMCLVLFYAEASRHKCTDAGLLSAIAARDVNVNLRLLLIKI